MTEQKQVKNNSRRTLYFNLIIIATIVGLFVLFQTQIDGRIESHPKIVELETRQDYIREELEKINEKLEVLEAIDWKLSKLLAEEYRP